MTSFNEINARKVNNEWNVFEGILNNSLFLIILVGTGERLLYFSKSTFLIYGADNTTDKITHRLPYPPHLLLIILLLPSPARSCFEQSLSKSSLSRPLASGWT